MIVDLDDKVPQMPRQLELPLGRKGEARPAERSEEASSAVHASESPGTSGIMEAVVQRDNLLAALKKVRANRGSPGVDGMTVDELGPWLRDHWLRIREELLAGTYRPQPVRQKLIPKDGGKTRMLGIPTVGDRFIQQALLQVLQPSYDPTFSDHSHGFRPGRSAHDALCEAREYVRSGRQWVVDVDLAKFFDRVNHDVLMGRLSRRIGDGRVLRLIRRFLSAGIEVDGAVEPRRRGTPQGGPLSPLLANVLLDEVDKELEQRGHAFVRYADDSRVFVRSRRAGERVFRLLRRLYGRLHLDINEEKSAVAPFDTRAFLGYEMYVRKQANDVGFRPSKKSRDRLRTMVKSVTRRVTGRSLRMVADWLAPKLRGWRNYFRLTSHNRVFKDLDGWIRRRFRALQLKQWKRSATIRRNLRALGGSDRQIQRILAMVGRWWRAAGPAIHSLLPNRYFDELGVVRLVS